LRASALKKAGGYMTKFTHKFDYELFSRLALMGKLANIDEVLVITRQHTQQFFRVGITPDEHRRMRLLVRWLTLWRLKPPFFLFIRTLTWLCFEYAVHLFPKNLRQLFPEGLRSFFKTNLPPNF
jgi:hypothetical protein